MENLLFETSLTLAEALRRLHLLRDFLNFYFFKDNQNFNLSISHFNNTPEDKKWLASLDMNLYKNIDQNNVSEFLVSLEKVINANRILTVYLPIEITPSEEDNICFYIRKLLNQRVFIEVKYDPNLIAGPAFVWNGIYKDYSLRIKIEEKKEDILKSFKEAII